MNCLVCLCLNLGGPFRGVAGPPVTLVADLTSSLGGSRLMVLGGRQLWGRSRGAHVVPRCSRCSRGALGVPGVLTAFPGVSRFSQVLSVFPGGFRCSRGAHDVPGVLTLFPGALGAPWSSGAGTGQLLAPLEGHGGGTSFSSHPAPDGFCGAPSPLNPQRSGRASRGAPELLLLLFPPSSPHPSVDVTLGDP